MVGGFSLSKNPGVDKGPQSLMFNPALTTCASERMKTQRFSYFADFAARERMREAKPVKLKKVAFSHFFDTLKPPTKWSGASYYCEGAYLPLRREAAAGRVKAELRKKIAAS